MRRAIALAALIGAVLLVGGGVALAGVSDGNYRPERQHCSGTAEDTQRVDNGDPTEPGCQNFTVNVRDGNDTEAARVGLPQLNDGESPDPTKATVDGPQDGFDPTTADRVYLGADDNLDNGEHDGDDSVGDGPSDGGAVVFNVEPNSVSAWVAALMGGDSQYLLTHPAPGVDAGAGSCADGVCESVQTQRRTAFDGGGAGERDVANYDGHTWDPESCSSASATEADCGPGGLKGWHDQNGKVYVEPGVQVYEDPSPAGSPIGPYPLPGLYAGTCGVVAGGGPLQMPASPVTNSAGQVVVPTQC